MSDLLWHNLGRNLGSVYGWEDERAGYYNTSNYANVADPDKAYAGIVRQQYDDYIKNYRDFENRLIDSLDDTPIEDLVRQDAPMEIEKNKGIRARNLDRYGGGGLSAAQLQEQERAVQRGNALSTAGAINQAKLADRDLQNSTRNQLMNMSLGLNRDNLSQLGSAAANANARSQAYAQARHGYSMQKRQFATGAAGALLASFFI